MGDRDENIPNAEMMDRSLLQDCCRRVQAELGEDVAHALRAVAEAIEHRRNSDAAENFKIVSEGLLNQLLAPQPKLRKSVLRGLWVGVALSMPAVKGMTEVGPIIAKLLT